MPFTNSIKHDCLVALLLLRMSLYTIVYSWVIGINDYLLKETLLDRVTAFGNCWKGNIYSGTVVASRVLDTGVWVAEIMDCSLKHIHNIRNFICRFVNSKFRKLTRHLYTEVLSNPVDINRNCLWVRHVAIYRCLLVRHDAISSCH